MNLQSTFFPPMRWKYQTHLWLSLKSNFFLLLWFELSVRCDLRSVISVKFTFFYTFHAAFTSTHFCENGSLSSNVNDLNKQGLYLHFYREENQIPNILTFLSQCQSNQPAFKIHSFWRHDETFWVWCVNSHATLPKTYGSSRTALGCFWWHERALHQSSSEKNKTSA